MNRKEGVVIAADRAARTIRVELAARAPACGNCPSAGGCQSTGLGAPGLPPRYTVDNLIGARPGDIVSLAVDEGVVWRAAWFSYGLPVLLVLLASALGQTIFGDAGALAGMLFGVIAALFILRAAESRAHRSTNAVFIVEPPHQAACHLTESP